MRRRYHPSSDTDSIDRAPFLKNVRTLEQTCDSRQYPFTIPALSNGIDIRFNTAVTLFVGENGSGKSTLLEAIAYHCGFHTRGGNRNHQYEGRSEVPPLASALRLSWFPKVSQGFFLRAESFFSFADYVDTMASDDPGIYGAYGGQSLHAQSHGESFFSLFLNRFNSGVYILDEPEAALSPQRQLAFLKIMHDLEQSGRAQLLIATHSPILLAYPGATILSLDGESIHEVQYRNTDHYRTTKDFLNHPEMYFHHLFGTDNAPDKENDDGNY